MAPLHLNQKGQMIKWLSKDVVSCINQNWQTDNIKHIASTSLNNNKTNLLLLFSHPGIVYQYVFWMQYKSISVSSSTPYN